MERVKKSKVVLPSYPSANPNLRVITGINRRLHILYFFMAQPMSTVFVRRLSALILALGLVFAAVPAALAVPLTPPVPPMPIAALPFFGSIFAGQRPSNLGMKNGQLSPCPGSPNCVVSQGNPDAEHAIAPIAYRGDAASALAQLESVITAMPRMAIIEKTKDYLYAEFTSRLMGYVDDVEFYLDPSASVIHVRSASRLGESDLGVNRKRIEAVRSALAL